MSFFNIKLLLIILTAFQKSLQNNECILSASIKPLKFITRRNTIEVRLDLTSNCTDYPLKFLYILKYSKVYNISLKKHPRRIIIDILGRAYQLDFSASKMKKIDGYDNLIYSKARISPSEVPVRFKTEKRNHVLLRTSKSNRFAKHEIERLEQMDNPVFCKLMKNGKTLVCKM